MRLMLSGEGKTDMGHSLQKETGWEFEPGPMALLVDRLLERHDCIGYSLLELYQEGGNCVRFVDETELAQHGKSGPTKLAGIKYGKRTGLFTRNAQVLGLLAKADRKNSGQPVVAVLFRDADSTRSSPRKEWQEKLDSIRRGFELAEFDAGAPMVPRPKSEAWLLCGLKKAQKPECEELENASGNDNSPNSLKNQLAKFVGHEPSAEEQAGWIKSGQIDPDDIKMPSFTAFRDALDAAIVNACA